MKRLTSVLLALLFTAIMATAQKAKQIPQNQQSTVVHGSPYKGGDEGRNDPTFVAFRQQLIAALRKHDIGFVRNVVDPNIRLGFGGDDGLEAFDREWHINDPNSEFWPLMSKLMSQGASYNAKQRTFTAPYAFNHWPAGYDPEKTFIIFDAAKVHAEPIATSKVVGVFNKEVVQYVEWVGDNTSPPESRWVKVRATDGMAGYLRPSSVYGMYGWRAAFQKQNGQWRVVFLGKGD